eukprot:Sspe_Gene.24843::Locus_9890_Transcript_1_1_Confidence_1.000_Length_4191::g.24843::m.24843
MGCCSAKIEWEFEVCRSTNFDDDLEVIAGTEPKVSVSLTQPDSKKPVLIRGLISECSRKLPLLNRMREMQICVVSPAEVLSAREHNSTRLDSLLSPGRVYTLIFRDEAERALRSAPAPSPRVSESPAPDDEVVVAVLALSASVPGCAAVDAAEAAAQEKERSAQVAILISTAEEESLEISAEADAWVATACCEMAELGGRHTVLTECEAAVNAMLQQLSLEWEELAVRNEVAEAALLELAEMGEREGVEGEYVVLAVGACQECHCRIEASRVEEEEEGARSEIYDSLCSAVITLESLCQVSVREAVLCEVARAEKAMGARVAGMAQEGAEYTVAHFSRAALALKESIVLGRGSVADRVIAQLGEMHHKCVTSASTLNDAIRAERLRLAEEIISARGKGRQPPPSDAVVIMGSAAFATSAPRYGLAALQRTRRAGALYPGLDLLGGPPRDAVQLHPATLRSLYMSALRVAVLTLLYRRRWQRHFSARKIQTWARSALSLQGAVRRRAEYALRQQMLDIAQEKVREAAYSDKPPESKDVVLDTRKAIDSDPTCRELQRVLLPSLPTLSETGEERRNSGEVANRTFSCLPQQCAPSEEEKAACAIQRAVRSRQSRLETERRRLSRQACVVPDDALVSLYSAQLARRFKAAILIRKYAARWSTLREARLRAATRLQAAWRGVMGRVQVKARRAKARAAARAFMEKEALLTAECSEKARLISREEVEALASLRKHHLQLQQKVRAEQRERERSMRQRQSKPQGIPEGGLVGTNEVSDLLQKSSAMAAQRGVVMVEAHRKSQALLEESSRLRSQVDLQLSKDTEEYARRMAALKEGTDQVMKAVDRAANAEEISSMRRRGTAVRVEGLVPGSHRKSTRNFVSDDASRRRSTAMSLEAPTVHSVLSRASSFAKEAVDSIACFTSDSVHMVNLNSMASSKAVFQEPDPTYGRSTTVKSGFTLNGSEFLSYYVRRRGHLVLFTMFDNTLEKVSQMKWDTLWTDLVTFVLDLPCLAFYSDETGELGVAKISEDYLSVREFGRAEVPHSLSGLCALRLGSTKAILLATDLPQGKAVISSVDSTGLHPFPPSKLSTPKQALSARLGILNATPCVLACSGAGIHIMSVDTVSGSLTPLLSKSGTFISAVSCDKPTPFIAALHPKDGLIVFRPSGNNPPDITAEERVGLADTTFLEVLLRVQAPRESEGEPFGLAHIPQQITPRPTVTLSKRKEQRRSDLTCPPISNYSPSNPGGLPILQTST